MSDQLNRAEAALAAFGDDDPQVDELLGALLERESVVGHPAALVVRGVVQYAIAIVDQPGRSAVDGSAADDQDGAPGDEQTPKPHDANLDREERIEHQYAEIAGRVVGALMFRAGLMSVTDPMDVLSRAHQAFEALRTEHNEL